MTTTRATLSNEPEKPKDEHKKNELIDTTESADTAKKEQDTKAADDKSKQAKLDKDALLERAKAKAQESAEEVSNDGLVPIYIPYPGTGLPVEKKDIKGKSTYALEVTIDGKPHLIPTNMQVRIPAHVKEAIDNTTHHGMKASTNEPVVYDK